MPRIGRPPVDEPKAHTIGVRVSDAELRDLQAALAEENRRRDVPIGLGTKLRLLGLAWARERRPTRSKRP